MSTLLKRMERGPLLILDGGLGTMLIARGLPAGAPPELWTRKRPEELLSVHQSYVAAGSEAVHANTFGANPVRLAKFGRLANFAINPDEINAMAVQLARQSGASFVIADMGPTGEYLPPVGQADVELWRQAFEVQGRALLEANVDAIHLETMSDLREARTALSVLRSLSTDIPIMASLTFDRKKKGFFTVFGDPLVKSLQDLIDHGANVVGANCTLTSHEMKDLAFEAGASIDAPLVFQPNAGQPEMTASGVRYSQSPEEFATDMVSLVTTVGNRVAAIGGCCGTDPRFIKALRRHLEQHNVLSQG